MFCTSSSSSALDSLYFAWASCRYYGKIRYNYAWSIKIVTCKTLASYFFSHWSRSASTRCTWRSKCSALTSTCLNLEHIRKISHVMRNVRRLTNFSMVSFTFFSAASSSSSSNCTFLMRPSFVTFECSPSACAAFDSLSLDSAFSRSASSTESLCWREVISWSFSKINCSYFLFLSSASSALSTAASASVRREASFYQAM